MPKTHDHKIDPSALVDQLYDIALDPQSLNIFIDAWNNAGLDASEARQTLQDIDQFDEAYKAHLTRAETFLSRTTDAEDAPDLAAMLTPFNTLAAFIVNSRLKVVAHNQGAHEAFGIVDGADLDGLQLVPEAGEKMRESLTDVFLTAGRPDRLLNIEYNRQRGPALFQIRRLPTHPA